MAGSLYAQAGVDIDTAHNLLDAVKGKLAAARRPEMLTAIGGFGGLFQLDLSRYRKPVLVSSVDGVGTKLMVAAMVGRHNTVGHDIVNHCINDIIVQGAEPLYFMDYIGIGRLRSPLYEDVLAGLADACRAQDVALLGGETAEMPGMYGDDYDLVGCITGVVDRDRIITGEQIAVGDVLIGLPASGLHTNGFSLARKILFEQCGFAADTEVEALGETVGEALLHPHRCYWPAVREALARELPLHGIAHITGGGLYDNLPRVLPDTCCARLNQLPTPPPIFSLMAERGDVPAAEMHRVFNMGVGMIWAVAADAAEQALACCAGVGVEATVVGTVTAGAGDVQIDGIDD
jgi:phosphoribosylformylglycinamidine cyclo-ligase